MNNLLENQKIRKRKSRSSSLGFTMGNSHGYTRDSEFNVNNSPIFRRRMSGQKPAFRPAGIISIFEQNSRFIEGIRQHPARVFCGKRSNFSKNLKRKEPRTSGDYNDDRQTARQTSRQTAGYENLPNKGSFREKQIRGRSLPVFSASIIPVSAILLLALGVFFLVYSRAGSFDWMDREVVGLDKDPGSQYNLALYAGINSGVTPLENLPRSTEDAIPLDLIETFSWQNYKVKKGDSVSKIAAAFSVSMDAIIASNNITNARSLRENEVIRIPNMDGIPYTVKSGDSLSGISQSMGVPLEAILDANDIQNDVIFSGMNLFIPGARMKREDLRMALGELFIYPLKGSRLSSPFGWRDDPFTGVRSYHAAVDLSAPLGTVVKAATDGTISAQGYNATYGNYIIISHPGGYQTMYAHLNSFTSKKGDQVGQGIQIGTVGSTGYSTGPHLHFAVFKNGRAVNPLDFLNPQK